MDEERLASLLEVAEVLGVRGLHHSSPKDKESSESESNTDELVNIKMEAQIEEQEEESDPEIEENQEEEERQKTDVNLVKTETLYSQVPCSTQYNPPVSYGLTLAQSDKILSQPLLANPPNALNMETPPEQPNVQSADPYRGYNQQHVTPMMNMSNLAAMYHQAQVQSVNQTSPNKIKQKTSPDSKLTTGEKIQMGKTNLLFIYERWIYLKNFVEVIYSNVF